MLTLLLEGTIVKGGNRLEEPSPTDLRLRNKSNKSKRVPYLWLMNRDLTLNQSED